MFIHEPSISFATPKRGRFDRITTINSYPKYHSWSIQKRSVFGIWQLAAGYSIAEASQMTHLHYTNAHKWVKRFQSTGLAGLHDHQRTGRPRIHGGEIEELVIKTATSRPPDLGLGFTTWSLAKLENHLRQKYEASPSVAKPSVISCRVTVSDF